MSTRGKGVVILNRVLGKGLNGGDLWPKSEHAMELANCYVTLSSHPSTLSPPSAPPCPHARTSFTDNLVCALVKNGNNLTGSSVIVPTLSAFPLRLWMQCPPPSQEPFYYVPIPSHFAVSRTLLLSLLHHQIFLSTQPLQTCFCDLYLKNEDPVTTPPYSPPTTTSFLFSTS